MPFLSDYIAINRRYSRSVNIERDMEIADGVLGYTPTSIAVDVLNRLLKAFIRHNSVRAWTLTGPYGTGKSAFAHFLTSLCAPATDQVSINAFELLERKMALKEAVLESIPEQGFLRAVVTGQREPIANTIVKALNRGTSIYWKNRCGAKPKVMNEIKGLVKTVEKGKSVDNPHVISVVCEVARKSKTGLLLVLDELGKNFEFAAQNHSLDDLYLLQQIAELPAGKTDPKVFIIGLLHQSFGDYSHGLSEAQRKEWVKIQGRFEDIPYADSTEGMLRLIGNAIDQSKSKPIAVKIHSQAQKWKGALNKKDFPAKFSGKNISKVFPLHPVTAVALPILCSKFSQNGRTLFSFLSSEEPHSFTTFLKRTKGEGSPLKTFKLDRVYDYFVDAAGMSFSLRPQYQRWTEIQSRISEANYLEQDDLKLLKTIGILNLVSTAGALKATRRLTTQSMCEGPNDPERFSYFNRRIDSLIQKGFLSYRKQLDELRIWEGSDFDIEKELSDQSNLHNVSLSQLLSEFYPQRPLIARRHSYQTGTVRYFERQYIDDLSAFEKLGCRKPDSDGLILYWVGKEKLAKGIAETIDEKPVVIIEAKSPRTLKTVCNEYAALKVIEKNAKHLQSDGVARREVRQRLLLSKKVLEETLFRSLDFKDKNVRVWDRGNLTNTKGAADFQKLLSTVCDLVYFKGLKLWNELANKRVTTTQGSLARRKLLEAMIVNDGLERLGLEGNGPEVSLFESILLHTGIYRKTDNDWCFSKPFDGSGVTDTWEAIESFCMKAIETPREIKELYSELNNPPYGVKSGVIPILLLSVLLYHSDSISFYKEGTFVPILGSEHFEVLVKRPEKFSVKSLRISGLRAHFFKEMEGVFSYSAKAFSNRARNKTIISIVRPLVTFAAKLPQYTKNTTEGLSSETVRVLKALLNAREPDKLLINDLPEALGYPPIDIGRGRKNRKVKQFCEDLIASIKKLQSSYDNLLFECKKLIHDSFDVKCSVENMRENLRNRSIGFTNQVTEGFLKRFIITAVDDESDDKTWLESVIMVISDRLPRSWTDDDLVIFSTNLADISRRFLNLEALQGNLAVKRNMQGYDVRLVTVTKPNGEGAEPQMVWIENENKKVISKISEEILEGKLKKNRSLQKAVIADLFEKVFFDDSKEIIYSKNKDKKRVS